MAIKLKKIQDSLDTLKEKQPVIKITLEDIKKAAADNSKGFDKNRMYLDKTAEERALDKGKQKYEQMVQILESRENTEEEQPAPTAVSSDDDWDVKITDPVEYFDPELSYELTGYRPITKDKGLDFNPKVFTVAADTYRRTGAYTDLIPGTVRHRKFWEEEFKRCQNGITIGKYTLTGENYFWLNYYRLQSVFTVEGGEEARNEDFPGFINKQYEYFHYIELCKKAKYDGLAFKGRGVGASEIAASNCSCAYTFHRQSRNVITAFLESQVTKTLSKVWQSLDFLNTCTLGAFRRIRMKIDTNMFKRASKVDANGNETGWKSEIEGITADEPKKLRGDRTTNLYFEEAGTNKKLIDTYIESEALVLIGGKRVGTRMVFGTSDSSGPSLAGSKTMFYDPEEYKILPYKNKYMRDGSIQFTGYFIPSFSVYYGDEQGEDFFKRGVVDEEAAKAYYNNKFEKIKNPQVLLRTRAEYCFTPEDGFSLEGENRFNQELLVEQLARLEIHKSVPLPRKASLIWKVKDGELDRHTAPEIEFNDRGSIQIAELPLVDESGIPFKDLYVAGIDSIDSDDSTSTGQTDVSKFAIVIMKRAYGMEPPKVVAVYKERPRDVRTAFDNAMKLLAFYNCKALIEATRTSIVTYFKDKHREDLLMTRPEKTISATNKRASRKQYGTPATKDIIDHYLDLIEYYVEDYCETIQFPDMINEFISYSFENKRKFDLVAAFGMCLLGNEDMRGKIARVERNHTKRLNLGYYTDEYGRKIFGKVPDEEETKLLRDNGWIRMLDKESHQEYL